MKNLLEKALGFDAKSMKLRTELIAGATTFLTMSYILAVNPTILSSTGMDKGALFTATALASAIATLLLAFMAKLPFAQAPSMGLNAFFAYTLCLAMGYTWQQALAIMLAEGVIFILITFFNIRELILESIPKNMRFSISAGIGMFIAFIGLKNADIIVAKEATFVGLGKFTPTCILGIVAILMSGILMAKNVKGSLFYGIIVATLVGIPLGVTQIPNGWIPVSAPQSLSPNFCMFDFKDFFTLQTLLVIFSLLIVNVFDTIGTIVGLAYKTGIVRADGSIPHVKEAMMSDAIGTTCGAMLGSSTLTTYVESASGIAQGGRTGLSALVTAVLFLAAMFFTPIVGIVPSYATAPALVIVGVYMMMSLRDLNFNDWTELAPSILGFIMMPLAYSVSIGIEFAIVSYVLIKILSGRMKDVSWLMAALAVIFVVKEALS